MTPTARSCRVCGCTDETACLVLDAVEDRLGCWWVEADLCSACASGPMPPCAMCGEPLGPGQATVHPLCEPVFLAALRETSR